MFIKPKVLVTGGAGFIGSHQVDALIDADYRVAVVDNLSTGDRNNLNPQAEFYELDIRESKLAEVFEKEKPDFVFHFAGQISVNQSVEDPVYDADVNIIGSLNLLEQCVKYKVKKIIFSSTGGALYGEADVVPTAEDYPCQPISPYGIAKLSVENYLRFYFEQFGLACGIMRYANVYGPRQNSKGEAGVIAIFTEKMLNRLTPIIHGDGHQTRDYVFVEDVVSANMAMLESEAVDFYNVGTSRQTTVNEVFNFIKKELASDAEPRYDPNAFAGQAVSCLSFEKIQRALGWRPLFDVEEGIKKTVEWFRDKENRK
ncbi:NAD-dependent epimerase/dehydratase family protein [Candidatus Falkowbacteria bacterium]|nr:NAD-dependent epimerase/dehydratase family protein [Candidatus Falkowbacteria bacterium]